MNEPTLVAQEQRGGQGLVVGALVVGGLIWLGTRQGRGMDGQQAVGGVLPAGMANVQGGVRGVEVSQQAVMSQVDKAVGSTLAVRIRFDALTTRSGQAVDWPYYAIVRIGHSTLFGWRRAGTSGLPDFIDSLGNVVPIPWTSVQFDVSGANQFVGMPLMTIPDDEDVTWDIRVQLRAQESDVQGNPTGEWMDLGIEHRENGAFSIISADNPASVSGGITTVTASQLEPSPRRPGPALRPSRQGLSISRR